MGFELLNRAFLLNQQLSEHIGYHACSLSCLLSSLPVAAYFQPCSFFPCWGYRWPWPDVFIKLCGTKRTAGKMFPNKINHKALGLSVPRGVQKLPGRRAAVSPWVWPQSASAYQAGQKRRGVHVLLQMSKSGVLPWPPDPIKAWHN